MRLTTLPPHRALSTITAQHKYGTAQIWHSKNTVQHQYSTVLAQHNTNTFISLFIIIILGEDGQTSGIIGQAGQWNVLFVRLN